MSKYTTELRYICEEKSGLIESGSYNSIEEVINNSWDKIFDFDFPLFDASYKSLLCKKFLKHFYTREIGFESYGLFKLKLDTKLNDIMPYYNQLYESQLLEFNPLYTTNVTKDYEKNDSGDKSDTENITDSTTFSSDVSNTNTLTNTSTIANTGSGDNTSTTVGTNNNTTSGTLNNSKNSNDMYSDTPQGHVTNNEIDINESYLTNARFINGTDSQTSSGTDNTTVNSTKTDESTTTSNSTKNDTSNTTQTTDRDDSNTHTKERTNAHEFSNTDSYLEHVMGYQNGSASKLLKEYRSTFLNIDLLIMNDLDELFMQLW